MKQKHTLTAAIKDHLFECCSTFRQSVGLFLAHSRIAYRFTGTYAKKKTSAASPFTFINDQCKKLGICDGDLTEQQLYIILDHLLQEFKDSNS